MEEWIVLKKKESFAVRSLKGLGFWLAGEIMCFVICLMTAMIMNKFMLMKIIMCICTMAITLGLFFQYAYNAARFDRDMVKFHGQTEDKKMPYKMAAVATAPIFIMLLLIIFVKAGAVNDVFYSKEYTYTSVVTEETTVSEELTANGNAVATEAPAETEGAVTTVPEEPVTVEMTGKVELTFYSAYLIGNIHVSPFVSLFTESKTIDGLSWGGVFWLFLLELTCPGIIILTYHCVFNDIDVKKLVMYK